MPTYELGILTTQTVTGNAAAEVVAGAAKPISILEMGVFLNAATASTFRIGRPGNTPTTGTLVTATLPIALEPGAGASAGSIALAGWGVAPTVPTAGNTMRMISLAAAIGNGVVWNWEPGELVVSPTRSSGLVLWNDSTVSAVRLYVKWLE